MSSTEVSFQVSELTLTAKHWANPNGIPTLALHGWLDNANTFDRLAPLLPELNLVALDFAGHGYSDHRASGVHYASLLDIQDVLTVADQLGWNTFNLIGHSMGASVSSELSGMFPERVESVALIDGILSTGGVPLEERIDQNREAIERMMAPSKPAKVFPDTETMAVRVTEATDQSIEAARVLVERGHKVVEGGVTWRTDLRIRFPTPMRPSIEYVDGLMARCDSPTMLRVANQGDEWYRGEVNLREASHPNLEVRYMDGPHHVHLEPKYFEQVAAEIRDFWNLDSEVAKAS